VAFASYTAGSGAVDSAIDTLSGGIWTAAKAPLPPRGRDHQAAGLLQLGRLPGPGNCMAVGSYTAQDGSTQALIETASPKQGQAGRRSAIGNDFHYQIVGQSMSRSTLRPVIKLRSTAGTGYAYVTRKSRRNDPDRLVVRKYDPVIGRHVEFREER
jgi:large subunit ribosomal protein L33